MTSHVPAKDWLLALGALLGPGLLGAAFIAAVEFDVIEAFETWLQAWFA